MSQLVDMSVTGLHAEREDLYIDRHHIVCYCLVGRQCTERASSGALSLCPAQPVVTTIITTMSG